MSPVSFLFTFSLLLSLGLTHLSPFDSLNFEAAIIKKDPTVNITATPNLLNQSGEWITVSWSGVKNPFISDWIGVYAPPTLINNEPSIDPSKQAPVKYQYCIRSPTHLESGEGSLRIRLVNLRAPYVFGFLTGGFNSPTLVAVSNVVKFTTYNEPLQGHLTLTHDPTVMTLTWNTKEAHEPKVKWWQNLTTYIRLETAVTSTYTVHDMCGPPATTVGYIDPGLFHTVNLTGLTPGREYNYQFGDDVNGQDEWSPVYTFRAPSVPAPNVSTVIIAYGDMGQAQQDDTLQENHPQPPSINNTKLIIKELNTTDLVLHIGDISYARGYAGVWDEFFDLIQPIATRVPYMVNSGNHERDFPNSGSYYDGTDSGGECGVPYERRFPNPRPSTKEHWYGFSIGNVHIVLMSTELDHRINSVQYNWLKDHLSKVDRSVTPWLIFSGHRPMYVNSIGARGDNDGAKLLRDNIEPLLLQYKVDLALWGHHHSYQRTCQVYQEKCTEGAPMHVVIGMAGQTLSINVLPIKYFEWLKFVDVKHYGYSRISTTQDTLTLEYITSTGQLQDSVTLNRTTTSTSEGK